MPETTKTRQERREDIQAAMLDCLKEWRWRCYSQDFQRESE